MFNQLFTQKGPLNQLIPGKVATNSAAGVSTKKQLFKRQRDKFVQTSLREPRALEKEALEKAGEVITVIFVRHKRCSKNSNYILGIQCPNNNYFKADNLNNSILRRIIEQMA